MATGSVPATMVRFCTQLRAEWRMSSVPSGPAGWKATHSATVRIRSGARISRANWASGPAMRQLALGKPRPK
jgi:hypothetical protein